MNNLELQTLAIADSRYKKRNAGLANVDLLYYRQQVYTVQRLAIIIKETVVTAALSETQG